MQHRKQLKDKQGMAAYKEGKSAMKTSMFKWSKDPVLAAGHFERAANLFHASKNDDMRIDSLLAAAECQAMIGNEAAAGAHYVTAAELQIRLQRGESKSSAAEYYSKASSLFLDSGDYRRAGSSLLDAAKMFKALDDMPEALKCALDACELFEDSDKEHYAMDTYRESMNFFAELRAGKELLRLCDIMEKAYVKLKQNTGLVQLPLIRAILHIMAGNIDAADKEFSKQLSNMDNWASTPECEATEELIRAFQEVDQEKLDTVKAMKVWGYMPNQVARLARGLTFPEGLKPATTGATDDLTTFLGAGSGAGAGAADVEGVAARSALFAPPKPAPEAARPEPAVVEAPEAPKPAAVEEVAFTGGEAATNEAAAEEAAAVEADAEATGDQEDDDAGAGDSDSDSLDLS